MKHRQALLAQNSARYGCCFTTTDVDVDTFEEMHENSMEFRGEHSAKMWLDVRWKFTKMAEGTESQKSAQCRGGVQIIFDYT